MIPIERYLPNAKPRVWNNRIIKALCFLSAFLACVLLLRPAAFLEVGASLPKLLTSGQPPATGAEPPSRGHSRFEGTGARKAEGGNLTMPQTLVIEEYKKVTSEIQERIYQEQILFALKFTIVGGILLALFSLSKREDFEEFIQRRRAAVFFSAALLASAVIDVRLRFDLKVVETLGVYCKQLAAAYPELRRGWEEIFEEEMKSGVLPVMRNFSLAFTALIYSVTTYLYIILPSGAHKGTWKVVKPAAILVFALLAIVGASYSRRSEVELIQIAAVLGAAGLCCLWCAFYIKARIAGVVDVVGPIVDRMSRGADMPPEVRTAESYLHWVFRAQRPEEFIRLVLAEAGRNANTFSETVRANARQSSLPEKRMLEAVDLFKKALPTDGSTINTAAFLKTEEAQRLKKTLSVDADEADWAEDYLWKYYTDHQNALRLGQFART